MLKLILTDKFFKHFTKPFRAVYMRFDLTLTAL